MNYESSESDGVLIFSLYEKKLDTNLSGLLKSEITRVFNKSQSLKYILHLPEIDSCDSSGLSALLVANRLAQSKTGILKIVTESEKILGLIKITRLDQVLSVCGTIEQAKKEMQKPT